MQRSDKKRVSNRGGVTSFMCIALSVIILFNVLLVDCARLLVLRETMERRTYLCAESLAADYMAELQKDYGLYGLYLQDSVARRNNAYEFLSFDESVVSEAILSAIYNDNAVVEFFDYEIDDLKLTHMEQITDPGIMKDNICSLMKYKVPADMLLTLTDNVDMFGKGSGLCEIQSLYAQALGMKETAVKRMEEINLAVSGNEYIDIGSVHGWETFGKKDAETHINMINGLIPVCSTQSDSMKNLKDFFGFLKDTLQTYKDYNILAVTLIYELQEILDELALKVDVLRSDMTELDFSVDINREYYKNMMPKIDGLEKFANSAAYSSALQKMKENISVFTDAETACNCVINGDDSVESIRTHLDTVRKIDKIKCDISTPEVSSQEVDESLKEYDISETKDTYIKTVFSNVPDVIIPDAKLSCLPSVESDIDAGIDISDVFNFFNNLDVENTDVSSFDGMAEIGEGFLNVLDVAMENIYINEYIMSFFYSAGEKSQQDRFFEAEIEYIISGKGSQKENTDNVYKQILAIRTTMNFIHILLDATKLDFANKIGNAIAVATLGIGGPIYAFIIMGIWATAEAAIDVSDLKEGESVPFYKNKGDWKLDIGAGNIGSAFLDLLTDTQSESGTTSKDSPMNMRYKDYLNILLLGIPQETKLLRICDLIEMNLVKTVSDSFDISDIYTGIACDLTISVKPFLNINFFKKKRGGVAYEMQFIGNSIY